MSNAKFVFGLLFIMACLGILLNDIVNDVCISPVSLELLEEGEGFEALKSPTFVTPEGCASLAILSLLIFVPIGWAILYLISPFHQ